MTDTMRRLGRVYAFRVRDAQGKGRQTIRWMTMPGNLFFPSTIASEARECATAGLEALALRAVLREMAETRRALPVLRSMAWRSR